MRKATRSVPLVKEEDAILAFTAIAGGVLAATQQFQVFNPSALLHLTLQIFARSANLTTGGGTAAHNYTGETWQLFTAATGTPDVQLNAVFRPGGVPTPQPLPDAYETETGTKLVNGVVVLQRNIGNPADVYILRSIWEPAHPLLMQDDDLRAELFQECLIGKVIPVNIAP